MKKTTAAGPPSFMRILKIFCVLCAILFAVNVWHPYLWGPDEPREAEIARETLADGNWIVAAFNRVPYVEKPPLYYDLAAAALALGGGHPGAARALSALLGLAMTVTVLLLGFRRKGAFYAVVAGAMMLLLPQFYRRAHWILLDIGVGASLGVALAVYGGWILRPDRRESDLELALFWGAAAAAFLTKGTVTLVYLGAVLLPCMIWRRRRLPCRLNWTALLFVLPVSLWIWLLWREGGVFYLHEHFINNIVGRLLHREFHLPGSPIFVHDVGGSSPFYFYLERSPAMLGPLLVILPFALAKVWRSLRPRPADAPSLPPSADATGFRRLWCRIRAGVAAATAPDAATAPAERDWLFFLAVWLLAPALLLSIPAIKEVTYLLPSSGAAALLAAEFLVPFADRNEAERAFGRCFLLPLLLCAGIVQGISGWSVTAAAVVYGIGIVVALAAFAVLLRRRRFTAALMLAAAAGISGVVFGNAPEVMRLTRLERKNYYDLAPVVWREVGDRELCMYGGDESIRGALAFYGGRTLVILPGDDMFFLRMAHPRGGDGKGRESAFCFIREHFRRFMEDPGFAALAKQYREFRPDFPKKADSFVLLIPLAASEAR